MTSQDTTSAISHMMGECIPALLPLHAFFTQSSWAKARGREGIADLVAGNPHEQPLESVAETFLRWTEPRTPDWYGYRTVDPDAARAVAASLSARRGMAFEMDDVFLTTGASGGIAAALRAVLDPGDEVVLLRPAWFFYEPMVRFAGGVPVWASLDARGFGLDLSALRAALTPRTRAVIVNSPHNPSGRAFDAASLRALARIVEKASSRTGRRIYLISDEAYCRILFDGREHVSPATFYPSTFIIYTFTKTLLTPGQRLGYLALPPGMPEREVLRAALLLAQVAGGHAFPNGPLQYAIAELEQQCIDVGALQAKRDRLVDGLRKLGYEPTNPEGTFYVMCRCPSRDDVAFAEWLARHDVYVLPASLVGAPGYVRLSLTATSEMLERALGVFAAGSCFWHPAAESVATFTKPAQGFMADAGSHAGRRSRMGESVRGNSRAVSSSNRTTSR